LAAQPAQLDKLVSFMICSRVIRTSPPFKEAKKEE
jgi:hypothetical protein